MEKWGRNKEKSNLFIRNSSSEITRMGNRGE
jgi:hypothetical protein